jgi:TPR repeat protein
MKSKSLLILIFLLGVVGIGFFCFYKRDPGLYRNPYFLSAEQLNELEIKGKTDASAAFKVHLHYAWAQFDKQKSLFWERHAATLGNANAQYNLAHQIKRNGGSAAEQQKWLSLSATQGMLEAVEELKQLKAPISVKQ